jgi:CRISPR/Cas system-associated endonuclease Cas1
MTRKKVGKREYLNDHDSKKLMRRLNQFFECEVEIPRIRHGKKQTVETLINEEALLLAKYLRNERKSWIPRLCAIQ